MLCELDGSGNLAKKFYYFNGQLAATKSGSAVSYYHNDQLGSPRAMTDASGNVIWRQDYYAFGQDYGSTATGNNYKFNAKPLEANIGLYYYGARYYDANIGRFVSCDPVMGSLENPQSLNPYSYCYNNPQTLIDPNGEFAFIPFLVALGIAALKGAVIGAAVSGAMYSIGAAFTGNWTWSGFGTAIGYGALGGAIGGAGGFLGVGAGKFLGGLLGDGWLAQAAGNAIGKGLVTGGIDAILQLAYNGKVDWDRVGQVAGITGLTAGIASGVKSGLGAWANSNIIGSNVIRGGMHALSWLGNTNNIIRHSILTLGTVAIGSLQGADFGNMLQKYAMSTNPKNWIQQGNINKMLDWKHVALGATVSGLLSMSGYGPVSATVYAQAYTFAVFEGTVESRIPWVYGGFLSDTYGAIAGN